MVPGPPTKVQPFLARQRRSRTAPLGGRRRRACPLTAASTGGQTGVRRDLAAVTLVVDRREIPDRRMATGAVVEALDESNTAIRARAQFIDRHGQPGREAAGGAIKAGRVRALRFELVEGLEGGSARVMPMQVEAG